VIAVLRLFSGYAVMATTANRLIDFGPLTGGHAIAAELQGLLAAAASDAVLVRGGPDAAGPVEVRRKLRVALEPSGGFEITRFSWCTKWRDAEGRFHARTFLHEPRRRPTATFDFPFDPCLPAAAAARGPLDADDVVVLRYIATRRITFRRGDAVVGKVKRRRTLERSYEVLRAVHAAASHAGFGVPEPLGVDPERGVFYQQRVPGRPVSELLGTGDAPDLMRRLGALHAAVHALDVPGLRVRPTAGLVAGTRDDASWVAFALPSEAGAVAEVQRRVVSELDALGPGAVAFCHGDPAADQVLLDGDDATVVDFDDAGLGDPYGDLGAMVAGLELDTRRLAGDPVAAYLEGYRERAGQPLDERRLRAHALRARLAMLASRLRKGRLSADDAASAVAELRASARRDDAVA
jgi:aminoglycoside phosphotransferase (APT) family kinase protein